MTVYRLIKAGDLPAVRVGRSFRVPRHRRRRLPRLALHAGGVGAPRAAIVEPRSRGGRRSREAGVASRAGQGGSVHTCPTVPTCPSSFLSDYGLADEFVGVCKAVDARARARRSASSTSPTRSRPTTSRPARSPWCVRSSTCPPGRSCSRSSTPGSGPTAGSSASSASTSRSLGPDNGLLAPGGGDGRRRRGGSSRSPTRSSTCRRPGPTFAGRDILAPAVAQLAGRGRPRRPRRGRRPDGLVPGLAVAPPGRRRRRDLGRGLVGRPLRQLPAQRRARRARRRSGAKPGGTVEVHLGGTARSRPGGCTTYADAKPSELVLVVDSYGLLSLALDRRSAADEYGLRAGSAVVLVPPGDRPTGRDSGSR